MLEDHPLIIIAVVIQYLSFSALIGAMIGARRGRSGDAAIMGAIFGPLGWAISWFWKEQRLRCPACYSVLQSPEASTCAACGKSFDTQQDPVMRMRAQKWSDRKRQRAEEQSQERRRIEEDHLEVAEQNATETLNRAAKQQAIADLKRTVFPLPRT